MKRILVIIAIAFSILTLTAPDAWARGRMQGDIAGCRGADCYECCHDGKGCRDTDCYDYRRAGCRGVDCAGVRTYSRAALETINGEVIDVYQATSRQGYKSGLHLLVKANEESINVHLGPISYIEGKNFNFESGDAIEIKGDRLTDSPMPTMTAIEGEKAFQFESAELSLLRQKLGLSGASSSITVSENLPVTATSRKKTKSRPGVRQPSRDVIGEV